MVRAFGWIESIRPFLLPAAPARGRRSAKRTPRSPNAPDPNNVPQPDNYYRSGKGRLFHPARGLSLPEHFFLWRHLHPLTLPELIIAGGEGVRVLQAARRGVDGLAE